MWQNLPLTWKIHFNYFAFYSYIFFFLIMAMFFVASNWMWQRIPSKWFQLNCSRFGSSRKAENVIFFFIFFSIHGICRLPPPLDSLITIARLCREATRLLGELGVIWFNTTAKRFFFFFFFLSVSLQFGAAAIFIFHLRALIYGPRVSIMMCVRRAIKTRFKFHTHRRASVDSFAFVAMPEIEYFSISFRLVIFSFFGFRLSI